MDARFDTGRHGEVDLRWADGAVTATYVGDARCHVKIRRRGAVTHPRTPLGTRDPRAVEVASSGGVVTVRPRGARFTKRSYRVDLGVDGIALDLSAHDLVSSEFRLSTIEVAHNVMAELTRREDGTVDVIWSAPVRLGRRLHEPPEPSREQLLVALAAAAAFGTGGLSLMTIVANAVDAILP
ncbi:hypothetical protein ACQ7HM_13785 [Williamsia sp. MIQD14]|uniref:hypothetical protein n=1 Tax=Williamsia sp. MIQD14 TaxID=3425703 RepID=UPI003DA001FF